MTVHENLAVQYHQQDTDYYCGAACAQMVLEQCGSGLLNQTDLYNDNHNHSTTESGWYTGPDGLTWTMNNRQSGRYFVLDALTTEDAISRMIAWTIHHYRVAPIAMVYGSDHWIVVRGYTASDSPKHSGDVGYSISGLDINNPWPFTPKPGPPPPHSAGDGCGTGGARGVADEHVSYATWGSTYMTGIPSGHWQGRFVAVCDPEPPPTEHPRETPPRRSRFDGEELIGSGLAAELSRMSLEEVGLLDRKDWRHALEGTEPGEALLVQRLDRANTFYWIVPQMRGELATVAVNIDARFGDYMQAKALPEPRDTAMPALGDREIDEAIYRRLHQLPFEAGQLRVRREVASVGRHWVWRPCRESLSPYYPFKLVSYGDHHLYVRIDGRVFTSLTPAGRGI